MGKLKTFLRREVRKARVKPPREDPRCIPTASPFNPLTSRKGPYDRLFANLDDSALFGQDDQDDVDSIFGEHVPTKEETQQAKLEQFLAKNPPISSEKKTMSMPRPQEDVYNKIKFLEEELDMLNTLGDEPNPLEPRLIHRQRVALEKEIRYLNAGALLKRQTEQKTTKRAELKEELARLPEPLSASEKRQIEWMKARRERERAEAKNSKTNKPKRKKGEYNSDDDLDGEERLRYGKSLKQKPVEITGRWNSVLHGYFPEENDGEARLVAEMSKEEKLLYRRELAEYGKKLALMERKKRERERKRL